jgi:putative peptide zinc metalloprotease protein
MPKKDIWKDLEAEGGEKETVEIDLWKILESREPEVSEAGFDLWKNLSEDLKLWKERPKLRDDLVTSRMEERGRIYYVVKDPVALRYFKLRENEYFILSLLDGNHELRDIVIAYSTKYRPINVQAVSSFLDSLDTMELIERKEENIFALLKARFPVRKKAFFINKILSLSFTIGDADKVVTKIYTRTRWLYTKITLLIISAIMLGGLIMLLLNIPQLIGEWRNIFTFQGSLVYGILLFYGLFAFVIITHEFTHALCCKHFGGNVHKIGVMLYYLMPCAFADTSDAWLFEKKSQRLWVSFAGPFCTLFWGSLSVYVWQFAPDAGVKNIAYTLIFACIMGSFANLNPLLEYDGYYMLVDYSGIPNLRKRAFEYTGKHIVGFFFRGQDVKLPEVTEKERQYFIGYGTLAGIYSIFALSFAVYLILSLIERFIGWISYILVAVLLLAVIYVCLKKFYGIVREVKK